MKNTKQRKLRNIFLSKEFIIFLFINLFGCMGLVIANSGVTWYIEKTTHNAEFVALFLTLSILFSFVGLLVFNKLLSSKNLFSVLKASAIIQLLAITSMTIFAYISGAAMQETSYMLTFIVILSIFNVPSIYIFQVVSRAIVDTNYLPVNKTDGNSVIEFGSQIAGIIGAICIGVLFTSLGILTFISVIIAMAITVALICLAQKVTNTHLGSASFASEKPAAQSIGTKEVLAFFKKHLSIFVFGILVWTPTILLAIVNSSAPSYVDNELVRAHFQNMTPTQSDIDVWTTFVFSGAQICYGVGGLLASVVTSLFLRKARIAIFLMWLVLSLTVLVFIFFQSVYMFFFGTFISSVAMIGLRIYLNTSMMDLVPSSIYTSVLLLLTAIGTLLQGVFTQFAGWLNTNDTTIDSFLVATALVVFAWIVTSLIGSKYHLLQKFQQKDR